MVGITQKAYSLRKAIAEATVTVSRGETITAIREKKVPKGDPFEFSRAAGLLAIKKTSDMIPDCHPLPVEFASISHQLEGMQIRIRVEVHAIYRTGVEVEAMHGASITALTIYDMLKPIDPAVEISNIRLVEKKGGKSAAEKSWQQLNLSAGVIVCSDSVSRGLKEDHSGKAVMARLENWGIPTVAYEVIPDDFHRIQSKTKELVKQGLNLIIFSGGTGLSPTDLTPDAIEPLLDRKIPGVMETARHFGQERTPYAMLSRGLAGFIDRTLILTLPGSLKGTEESMDALFPQIFHVFNIAAGGGHDKKTFG